MNRVADLPVEDFDLEAIPVGFSDEHALRAKPAVDHAFLMGEADDLGNLPHQVESLVHAELLVSLSKKVVEPNRQRVMLEDKCRAEFMFSKPFAAKNPGMLKCFQQFRFAAGGAFNRLSLVVGCSRAHVVDANATPDVFQRGVSCLPVLIT